MQIITKYISDTGEEFLDEASCLAYEDTLDLFNGSCEEFFSGRCSLYDVFAAVGYSFNFNHSNDITNMLRSIHRGTKLTIRHWQGYNDPKYSVSNLSLNKWMSIEMYFGGHSSIGSGFYQSKVRIDDLLRYYNYTFGIKE